MPDSDRIVMTDISNSGGGPDSGDEDGGEYLAYRQRASGTNINEQTLLATDYLNHFNEIVMLLEMVPDMPECLDEAKSWRPRTYVEHFQASAVADAALAADAYDHAPARYREPFERTTGQIDRLIAVSIDRIERAAANGDAPRLRWMAKESSRSIQRLLDVASAIIHGSEVTMDQAEIDALLAD